MAIKSSAETAVEFFAVHSVVSCITSGTGRRISSARSARCPLPTRAEPEHQFCVSAGSITPSSHSRAVAVIRDYLGASYCARMGALEGCPLPRPPTDYSPLASILLAADRRLSTDGGLLAAHHGDARIRPHPQEPRRIGAAAHAVIAGAVGAADHDREFRHAVRSPPPSPAWRRRVAMPPASYSLADHEAGDVLQEHQRPYCAGQHSSMKCARLSWRTLAEQDAVIGNDADRIAPRYARKPQIERRAVFSFLNSSNSRQPSTTLRDDVMHVERLSSDRPRPRRRKSRSDRKRAAPAAPCMLTSHARVGAGGFERGDDVARAIPKSRRASFSAHSDRSRRSALRMHVGAAELFRRSPPRRSQPSPAAGRRGRWCLGLRTITASSLIAGT